MAREVTGFAGRGIRSALVAIPPAVSLPAEQATGHFGPFGAIMTMGLPPLSSDATRELLGWKPEHPGLLADLDEGHYFAR